MTNSLTVFLSYNYNYWIKDVYTIVLSTYS